MLLRVYKAELYKILTSCTFKIAFVGILIFSTCNIIIQYRYFPDYDSIYRNNKKSYIDKINYNKKVLSELDAGIPSSSTYYKLSSRVIETDKYIFKREVKFYDSHELPELKKDFSQGLEKSVFNYYWLPILLLFCCNIVCGESAKNITKVQFSSYTDKRVLYHSKYLALVGAMIFIFILNLIFSYILSGCLMGFSDLSGSMRAILGHHMATVERSIKEFLILKVIFGVITCASSAGLFLFISTIVKDAAISYIISSVLVLNAISVYYESSYTFFKYSLLSFYYASNTIYMNGNPAYDIKIALISMFIQTVLLYLFGLYVYKRSE